MSNIAAKTTDENSTEMEGASRQWEEVEIEMPWGHVSGKWYGNRSEKPIIALHGWLDNAATFDRLIPLLPQKVAIFSIDLPGHGRSSHFPKGIHYYIYWDYIPVIRRIIKHFGWQMVTILGHSMGGGIAFMYAASYPKDVEKIICLDSYGPVVRNQKTNAAITGYVIDKTHALEAISPAQQPKYLHDDVVKRRSEDGSIDPDAAKILLTRSLIAVPGCSGEQKYTISTDSRLKFVGLALFTLEHVMTYASMIQCPILNIKAIPGIKYDQPEVYQKVLNVLRNNVDVEYHEVTGSHYVHLESPEKIANIITMFLLNVDHF